MNPQPFRLPPALPAHAMQTYRILAPRSTHWHPVSCLEAQCDAFLHGWLTTVDEATDLGRRQAHYIRRESGRKFTEERDDAGLTRFDFEAGQQCFAQHQERNSRPERYLVVGGDWRGNPRGERREHSGPEPWVADFAEHQDRLRTLIERG